MEWAGIVTGLIAALVVAFGLPMAGIIRFSYVSLII